MPLTAEEQSRLDFLNAKAEGDIYAGMKPDEARAYIKSKRPIAFFPMANFGKAIEGYYNSFTRDIQPILNQ